MQVEGMNEMPLLMIATQKLFEEDDHGEKNGESGRLFTRKCGILRRNLQDPGKLLYYLVSKTTKKTCETWPQA